MPRFFVIFSLIIFLAACDTNTQPQGELPTLIPLPGEGSAQAVIPAGPMRLLNFWETETDTLSGMDEIDVWQFVGQQGDAVRVRVVPKDITVILTLQTQSGQVLSRGPEVSATLQQNAAYTVLAQLAEAGNGSYDIGLGYTDRPNPNIVVTTPLPEVVGVPTPTPDYSNLGVFVSTLSSGDNLTGTLTETEFAHVYVFNARAGQYVLMEMARISGTVDPILTLFDPSGTPLTMDDNSGGGRTALLRNVVLPEDGTYTIQVSGDGFFGDYSLKLTLTESMLAVTPLVIVEQTFSTPTLIAPPTLGPAIEGRRLEDHVPVAGLITPGDFKQHSLFAEQGTTLTLGVQPVGQRTLHPQVEIYDPDGALVASAKGSASSDGTAFVAPFTVVLTGAYIVFVTSEDGSAGEYVISYGVGPTRLETLRGFAEGNARINGTIDTPALRDAWQVNLQRGDIVTAAVSPGDASLDPVIEVALPDGTLLASDDNSGGGRAGLVSGIEITEDGAYFIRVRDATGTATGSYTMVWRYINRAPTPTPLPNAVALLSVDDAVAANAYNFYVFQGKAGQRVRVTVKAKAGSQFDPVAVLLAPDGTEIAQGDDNDGLNPLFLVDLPADGTYTVRVNGYLTSGPFDLVVELLF